VYASKQIPLKITVTKNKNTLIIQATGQQAFAVETIEKDKFTLNQVGATFKFNPAEETMILFQGGGKFIFTRE
jgi:lipopolysaccharide export system protein LptA